MEGSILLNEMRCGLAKLGRPYPSNGNKPEVKWSYFLLLKRSAKPRAPLLADRVVKGRKNPSSGRLAHTEVRGNRTLRQRAC